MVDCYVIVTTRNILWMVLSVVATLAVITGIMTPKWLYGRSKIFDDQTYNSSVFVPPEAMYKPSVGIYNRCKKIQRVIGGDPVLNCYSYIEDFMEIPSDAWKACMVFLCFGVFLLGVAGIMSLVGFCVQSVGKKSIFSLGGLIQAIAGITRCNKFLFYQCNIWTSSYTGYLIMTVSYSWQPRYLSIYSPPPHLFLLQYVPEQQLLWACTCKWCNFYRLEAAVHCCKAFVSYFIIYMT